MMMLLAQSASEWLKRGDWIGICLVLVAGTIVLYFRNQKLGDELKTLMKDCTGSRVENTKALEHLASQIKISVEQTARNQTDMLKILSERFKG